MSKAPEQDPAHPAFWDTRYRAGTTPWDSGVTPPRLARHLEATPGQGRFVQIPGCGSAYEVLAFAEAGYVPEAIDISQAAVERAMATLGPLAHRVRLGDFFAEDKGTRIDVIYERAFLCALPRRLWQDYGKAVSQRLAHGAGGELLGFFYIDSEGRGPPFAIEQAHLEQLLGDFECIEVEPVEDVPAFGGRSHWMRWRRKIATVANADTATIR
jgi:Thiopurine S-methyltransferase (TPMT)